jgi:hypothetical protein
MKLTELLSKITPLPWTGMHRTVNADTLYMRHSANTLPELVKAARLYRNRTRTDGDELMRLDAALAAAEEVRGA